MIKDYPYLFEKTIEAYWGNPKTPIYFANYWGEKFEMRAIIFSIVVKEINYNFSEYTDDELTMLKDFEKISSDDDSFLDDSITIIDFLAKHKNIL